MKLRTSAYPVALVSHQSRTASEILVDVEPPAAGDNVYGHLAQSSSLRDNFVLSINGQESEGRDHHVGSARRETKEVGLVIAKLTSSLRDLKKVYVVLSLVEDDGVELAQCGVKTRIDFSPTEDLLLLRLGRRLPKISWRQIGVHFPRRSVATLKVRFGRKHGPRSVEAEPGV
ncbi:hypothetical protein DL95DRAFT_472402 [Leptodontidium sp. 2 PMI_412]|nr:hypothetical protein DL95DRAFT_472402 [Leptodontidium sp. 2 PMI_412]